MTMRLTKVVDCIALCQLDSFYIIFALLPLLTPSAQAFINVIYRSDNSVLRLGGLGQRGVASPCAAGRPSPISWSYNLVMRRPGGRHPSSYGDYRT